MEHDADLGNCSSMTTLLPFIYSCQKCGMVYHTDRLLSGVDPRICQACQSIEDENETRLCQWCGEPVGPNDILCSECDKVVVCYAEMPAGTFHPGASNG